MMFKEQFDNWINLITKSGTPSKDIVAFNFGLFESEKGHIIYVIGSTTFDEDDSDWATAVAFEPKDKYLAINSIETEGNDWTQVLEKVRLTIEEFVSSNKFENSFLKNAQFITTGYDDGDLLRIK